MFDNSGLSDMPITRHLGRFGRVFGTESAVMRIAAAEFTRQPNRLKCGCARARRGQFLICVWPVPQCSPSIIRRAPQVLLFATAHRGRFRR